MNTQETKRTITFFPPPSFYVILSILLVFSILFLVPEKWAIYSSDQRIISLARLVLVSLIPLFELLFILQRTEARDGIIQYKILGIPFRKIVIAEVRSIKILSPFLILEINTHGKRKKRYLLDPAKRDHFLEILTEGSPGLRIDY